MTRFEEIGQKLQMESMSKAEANERFKESCDRCINSGRHIDCDRCAIAGCNKLVCEIFDNLAVINKNMKAAHRRVSGPVPVL